ncbi:MAG TPA: FAD-binding oxidoreductase [Candidatus Dormibacteraeota bacterium]|nr:FAD-binding oxidoreductase [Candidatus Dormibacteraeota bacterium]
MELDPAKFTSGRVVARRDLAADLWVVRVRADSAISFRCGQYVTVGVEVDGELRERPYSIVSAPAEGELELFLELVPDGYLTPHLHDLADGQAVALRTKTKGIFLRECPVAGETHVFVATVTGVAPFVSLLRTLAERTRTGEWTADGQILLLQGASRSWELGYLDELRALEAEMPWFTYVPTVSRPWEDPEWTGETGRAEDVLRKHADAVGASPGRAGVYLCGHPGMISGARGLMRRAGLADKAIREEQYWPEKG